MKRLLALRLSAAQLYEQRLLVCFLTPGVEGSVFAFPQESPNDAETVAHTASLLFFHSYKCCFVGCSGCSLMPETFFKRWLLCVSFSPKRTVTVFLFFFSKATPCVGVLLLGVGLTEC